MFELWISDGFEWFFALNFLYPNLLSSPHPSNSYSCPSQWSFDQIFWFVVSKAICCGILQKSPTFPCKQGHEAMKNCWDSLPEAWGPWEPQYAPPARSMSELWISDGFEWFFALNFLYPNLLSSFDPSNSYSCLSQWSFDQIFWFVVSKAICCGISQMRPHFHVNRATKQWRIVEIPYQKLEVPESRPTSNPQRLKAEVRSTSSAVSSIQELVCRILILISVVLHCVCFKSTKSRTDSAFSLCGLEVGLPAFQLTMFAKCDALTKRDMVSKIFCNTVIVSKIWTTGNWLIVLSVLTCDGCQPMNSGRNWSCSNSGLEVGLPDFHGRKMCRTAEKRYIWSPRFLRYSECVQDLDYSQELMERTPFNVPLHASKITQLIVF